MNNKNDLPKINGKINEEASSLLGEKIIGIEQSLKEIMGKVRSISGRLIAYESTNSNHRNWMEVRIKNQTTQLYEIQKVVDILLSYKESACSWSEEDDFDDDNWCTFGEPE